MVDDFWKICWLMDNPDWQQREDGSFQYSYVRDVRGGIRPAIWLKLN